MLQNCVASASVGCIVCCSGCQPKKVINSFTFLPPEPASYQVCGSEDHPEGPGRISYVYDALKTFDFYQEAAQHAEVHYVTTACKSRVVLVWVRGTSPPEPPGRRLVILHCHGNATDIGMMMGPYYDLTKRLGVEVVGVEYSGYGCSSGSPSARNTIADIDAAYKYLVQLGVPPELIVVYGQSVGSGPAVGLASKRKVGGLILHSPMMSGIKVIDPKPNSCCRPSCVYYLVDFFPNDVKIKDATSPVFVIHGQADEIVKVDHGRKLCHNVPQQYRWPGYFPKVPGHNDIVESDPMAYFSEVAAFLKKVARSAGIESTVNQTSIMGKSAQPPPQVTMTEMGRDELEPPSSSSEYRGNLPFREPIVGPEDGRYQQLRHDRAPANADRSGASGMHPVMACHGGK